MSGLLPKQAPSAASQDLARPPFDPSFKNAGGLPNFSEDLNLEAVRDIVKIVDEHQEIGPVFYPWRRTDRWKPVYWLGLSHKSPPNRDDVIFATIEYRLAPENCAPAGAHDCYAGLVYLADSSEKFGIDLSKFVLYGISGGGPLAAATCILSRNLKYPQIRAQMLPMIDDRDDTGVSWKQFETGTLWPGKSNRMAWEMVLGSARGGPHVDEIQCPARATDLSNLPPAFIDVGECEVFPGVYHGAHVLEDTPVTRTMVAAEKEYLVRVLGRCED